MSHVFGPVPSRRLGRSLGIDPLPLKTCNFSCLYCQLGRTRPLVHERREYAPTRQVVAEVAEAVERLGPGAADWMTFVASGEPTLHSRLGWMIRKVKALSPRPVAVITNGSLLHTPAIRGELAAADAVLPSLDAGSRSLFRRIARPHPTCTFERLVEGLIAFRRAYSGTLWLEVMLLGGVNDSVRSLSDIASVIKDIEPDGVHLSVPTRPPAEPWVRPPDTDGLARAGSILGRVARIIHPPGASFAPGVAVHDPEALMDIITRHPMRQDELEGFLLGPGSKGLRAALEELESAGRAQRVERHGVCFWAASGVHYPGATQPETDATPQRLDTSATS